MKQWQIPTLIVLSCGLFIPAGLAERAPKEPIHAVTLPQAHKGTLQNDTLLLDSFGRPSEERRSFYLSARQILVDSPDATPADSRMVEAAENAGLSLISGPMLGDLSENGITVWFRPVRADKLKIRVATADAGWSKECPMNVATPGDAMRVRLDGLNPGRRYTYEIVNPEKHVLGKGSFRTAPAAGSAETLRIAFGSCFHKIGLHNPNLMRLIEERGNQAMLILGDIAADDRNAALNMHYADYLLRDASEPWRAFSANIPVYASWDDHDYLDNDLSGLEKTKKNREITPQQRNALRTLWQDNWVNPPTTVADRGIYFNTVIGDVEIIMLDTRSCRDGSKRGDLSSYLGDEQMQWLLQTLKASTAKFVLLTSGTMWSDFMSGAKDTWGTWDVAGRAKIFSFIEEHEIGGVLLLSGDRHGARGFEIKRPSGFSFVELEAATLGTDRGPGAFAPDRSSQLFGYKGGLLAFGELTFDMDKSDPEVTFRLIGEAGEELEKHIFSLSRLTPGSKKP